MKLKVKYLADIEPISYTGGSEKSNWVDLRSARKMYIRRGESCLVPLGVAIEIPEGYEAIVAPRSSTFKHFGILMNNSIGVIDTAYKGDGDQWHFPAYAVRDTVIDKNERICQFRIIKRMDDVLIESVDTLGNPDRGGIGSTGR